MRHPTRTHRGFTLIELLSVIAIIAILAALLFPAIKSALIKAEVVKAQSAISNLGTAFKAYYTEYGKWPVNDTAAPQVNTYLIDQNFIALLEGVNNTSTLTGTTLWNGPFTPMFLNNGTLNGNPRGIHFLDFKSSDLDPAGTFVDPWKTAYYVRFDAGYSNSVPDPFTGGPGVAGFPPPTLTNIGAGFLIWSSGPDGQYDWNGDAVPLEALSPLNKDNVKNW